MRARRHRPSRLFALVPAVLALVTGTTLLASNTVAPSRAGVTQVPVVITAMLTSGHQGQAKLVQSEVDEAKSVEFADLNAKLTSPYGPISGASVTFSVDGIAICDAVTKVDGSAGCSSDRSFRLSRFGDALPMSYTASFAGEGPFAAVTAAGALKSAAGN